MPLNFKHINAAEQVLDGSITPSLFAPNILVSSINSDSNPNLTGAVQLVSGTNVTLSQTGNSITINATGSGGSTVWGSITGTLSNQTDLQTALNSKQATLTIGNLTDTGTDGIVITGGTGSIIGSGTSLSQHVADTTHNGYLSSTDWNTFNGKQNAGSYITALTGDVTATGPGSSNSSIVNGIANHLVTGETPSGTVDGTNTIFTLAFSPNPVGTQQIYRNGLLQKEGSLADYTILSSTVTFNIAPVINSRLLAIYWK